MAELQGLSLIGGEATRTAGEGFHAVNPADGTTLEPEFHAATQADVERAAELARAAAAVLGSTSGAQRAQLLRAIAEELTADGAALVARAQLETGLPTPRLEGELARTTGQLRLFAEVVETGAWVDARIDEALPERKPLPRPDIRSMLVALGPVAVFGASNFPLAFSVAGGDTASALAAGNPVLVKAHPAHPGTSEIAGLAIARAVNRCSLPAGVFALLFDAGIEVGQALVRHPAVKAVGFTGSARAGQALMKLCAERPEPIPCYAEMGSTNPLFVLPGALRERGAEVAQALAASFTLGSGQFCTKPGLVFVQENEAEAFVGALEAAVKAMGPMRILTPGIARAYAKAVEARSLADDAVCLARGVEAEAAGAQALPIVFSTTVREFLASAALEEEIFGPITLLIRYRDAQELLAAAEHLHGHLTATIHAAASDLAEAQALVRALTSRVGRVLFNGFPTGVEVCHAMVHGGPFPATSDGRSTSVGTRALLRFARAVCLQDFPDAALPAELQRANPLGIARMVNGVVTSEPQL